MTEITLPAYHELKNTLEQTALKLHPSQVHGLLCGILCGDIQQKNTWQEFIPGQTTAATFNLLEMLYLSSAQQLREFLFEFELLLPDDNDSLTLRAEALTLWAQGFLTGLKAMHISIHKRSPDDVTEAIDDLIEIAKMNYEAVVATEEDEAAYMELVEYIRMAVILIYQDLHGKAKTIPATKPGQQLH